MEIYRVAFIGHRQIIGHFDLVSEIERLAKDLLRQKEYVEFYVGHHGDFDLFAASAVKQAQKAIGPHNSSLILVQPFPTKDDEYYKKFYDEVLYPISPKTHPKAAITKRNQWIMDQADLLITYVEKDKKGGAYTAFRYMKKKGASIINLAGTKNERVG